MSLAFPATGSRRDLLTFLGVLAVLFLLAALAPVASRSIGRRSALVQIFLFALLFRFLALLAGLPPGETGRALADDLSGQRIGFSTFLLYDDDVWRYLWDGSVAAAGLDPYRLSPQEIRDRFDQGEATPAEERLLAHPLAFDLLDSVRFGSYRTIYPPLAQHLFRLSHLLAPGSVFLWKLLMAAFDLGTCLLLARLLVRLGRPPEVSVLYAWNPLAIKELAGSGHVDAVMIFFLVLAAERALASRDRVSMGAYGASVLAKLATLPLGGLFLRRCRPGSWWLAPAVGIAIALPFWNGLPRLGTNLAAFGQDWEFNAGPWKLAVLGFEALGVHDAVAAAHLLTRGLALALVLGVTLKVRPREDRQWIGGIFAVLAGLVLLSPAVMPWYLLWALPFAVALGFRSWEVLAALSCLSYLVYSEQAEHPAWLWAEYGAFAAVALQEALRRRSRTGRNL